MSWNSCVDVRCRLLAIVVDRLRRWLCRPSLATPTARGNGSPTIVFIFNAIWLLSLFVVIIVVANLILVEAYFIIVIIFFVVVVDGKLDAVSIPRFLRCHG